MSSFGISAPRVVNRGLVLALLLMLGSSLAVVVALLRFGMLRQAKKLLPPPEET